MKIRGESDGLCPSLCCAVWNSFSSYLFEQGENICRQGVYSYMKKYIEIENGFTHGGKFHADDVFSTALLMILNPDFKVKRGFEVPEDFEGIVYDVGFGKFDHHQQDREVRENGVPYAAFGLLWKEFGSLLLGEKEAQFFDEKFVQGLDLNDNTGAENQIADMVSYFNPPWDYAVPSDQAFMEAVELAKKILTKQFEYVKSIERAEHVVKKAMENSQRENILVMQRSAPWKRFVKETEIKFVVFPSNRGGFCAQAVPSDTKPDKLKCPFPEEWRGVAKELLPEVSGIEGLHFCHNSGFLISASTKEDAIRACEAAMDKENCEK